MGSLLLHITPSTALPLRHIRARVSCCSSGHVSFIKEVAATEPPMHLHHLLKVLQTRGETIISPGAKQGLIPLAIPLSKNSSGSVTALLRWPTAPPGMDMPVVEVWRSGVRLVARNVDEYIHRILVEEDAQELTELYRASAEAGEKLYKKGAFAESQIDNLDVYVLKKVGLFPDLLERKVLRDFKEGDHVRIFHASNITSYKPESPFDFKGHSILSLEGFSYGNRRILYKKIPVSGIWTTFCILCKHIAEVCNVHTYNVSLLNFLRERWRHLRILICRVGRNSEAKDAARVALKSPWWTLGCPYEEVASIAQWEDEQIEFIREKVSDEGRLEDLKKGKDPIQVALDVAAFLLDLASIEGTWSESLNHIAKCYKEAGLDHISNFILYTD